MIRVHARTNCRYCMGKGVAIQIFSPTQQVCSCVLEQLEIVTTTGDPSMPAEQRYRPGRPKYITAEDLLRTTSHDDSEGTSK